MLSDQLCVGRPAVSDNPFYLQIASALLLLLCATETFLSSVHERRVGIIGVARTSRWQAILIFYTFFPAVGSTAAVACAAKPTAT